MKMKTHVMILYCQKKRVTLWNPFEAYRHPKKAIPEHNPMNRPEQLDAMVYFQDNWTMVSHQSIYFHCDNLCTLKNSWH